MSGFIKVSGSVRLSGSVGDCQGVRVYWGPSSSVGVSGIVRVHWDAVVGAVWVSGLILVDLG